LMIAQDFLINRQNSTRSSRRIDKARLSAIDGDGGSAGRRNKCCRLSSCGLTTVIGYRYIGSVSKKPGVWLPKVREKHSAQI
jgi:hypothetical protein